MAVVQPEELTILVSASRTATQTSLDIPTNGCQTVNVVLDMTTVGTGSVTIAINGKDSASGKYYLLLAGAAVVTNSTNRYKVGATVAASANVAAQDYVPNIIQIVVTANNANAAVYSVGLSLMP